MQLKAATAVHTPHIITRKLLMKISMDIPDALISEAMKITGSQSAEKSIITALQELVKSEKRKRLITMKGKIDLDIDLDQLRDRNWDQA